MQAVFLGLPLQGTEKKRFSQMHSELSGLHLPATLQKADTPHITLRYFGEVSFLRLETIKNVAKDFVAKEKPFEAKISGVDYFGLKKRRRVVWMPISSYGSRIVGLQNRLESCLQEIGFSLEVRDYNPHFTVARVKKMENFAPFEPQMEEIIKKYEFNLQADRVTLYGMQDNIHQMPLAEFKFGG